MKKLILITTIFFAFIILSNAQDTLIYKKYDTVIFENNKAKHRFTGLIQIEDKLFNNDTVNNPIIMYIVGNSVTIKDTKGNIYYFDKFYNKIITYLITEYEYENRYEY